MEQTVNTWSKGLQMDTNPMVLGNDTLTNALNATFITMNSNEVILQNDMGNRRVDSAFLPAGYEPVGIKEYGGIIYIASYNPITNKCLIGSFPSPQMNYGKEDNISSNIDENLFTQSFKEANFGNILFLKNFSILSPFRKNDSTKDEILHAGDKFCVYFSEDQIPKEKISYFNDETNKTNELEKLITNYNNVYTYTDDNGNSFTKLYSPKNKKYTLSLGIMNSLNLFADFTPTLLRWDLNDEIIEFDSETPDYIKFNTGYFIPKGFNSDSLGETINDAAFIRNRLKLPANTYIYKLAGPLYIKKDLNVISNMTFNYYGSEINDPENDSEVNIKYQISLDIFYEYNCPDFSSFTGILDSDNKYVTYENNPSNITECFIGSNIKLIEYKDEKSIDWKDSENKLDENYWRKINDFVETGSKITYNPVTNTYKIKKHYVLNEYVENGDKYLLRIVPFTSYGLGIRNLSRLIIIDSNKLKSNELSISDFRFKRDGNTMKVCLGFTGYMAGIGSISDIKMEIIDNDEMSPIITKNWPKEGINGTHDFDIEFDEHFKERRIYLVKISWNIDNSVTPLEVVAPSRPPRPGYFYDDEESSNDNEESSNDNGESNNEETSEEENNTKFTVSEYRWIVTTNLFNDFYENNVVKDYGNPDTYNRDFREALVVKPDIDIENEGEIVKLGPEYISNVNNKIFSEEPSINETLIYGLKGGYLISNRKISLTLGEEYPIELNGTTFSYDGKSIKASIKEFIDDTINEREYDNINSYGQSNYGLRIYKEHRTTGFNENSFTVNKDDNEDLIINYNGDFLIKESISGNYTTTNGAISIKNVFRSVFDLELTTDKLFDLCGAVGIFSSVDHSEDQRYQINFTFLHKTNPSDDNNNILNCEEYIRSRINGEYYYTNDTTECHHFEIDYPNRFEGRTNDENYENYGNFDVEDINKVLSDSAFDEYYNYVLRNYPNKDFPQEWKFKLLNKNFIIGTTNQGIITSFETKLKKDSGIYQDYELFQTGLRPIMLWMRVDSGTLCDWAMLPLIDTGPMVRSKVINNLQNNDPYKNNELVNTITSSDLENYGYIGNNLVTKILLGNWIYSPSLLKNINSNDLILLYLKSRIKNFYYKCNKHEEETTSLFKFKKSSDDLIFKGDKIELCLELNLRVKSNISENLSIPLLNHIFSIFNTESNISYKNVLNKNESTILFDSRKGEIEEFNLILDNTSDVEYAIYDEGKYRINFSELEFLENDERRLFIKDDNGYFQRLEGINISNFGENNEEYFFPYITPSYDKPCGIGIMESPIITDLSSSIRLGFDFKRNTSKAKYEIKVYDENSTDKEDKFPPTIPSILLKELSTPPNPRPQPDF